MSKVTKKITSSPAVLLQHLASSVKRAQSQFLPPTAVGFIVFKSIRTAAICAQAVIYHEPGLFISQPAPEPEDIKWSNLQVTANSQILRRILMFMATILVIFLWGVSRLVSGIQSLRFRSLSWLRCSIWNQSPKSWVFYLLCLNSGPFWSDFCKDFCHHSCW